jgi:hypothetical protein
LAFAGCLAPLRLKAPGLAFRAVALASQGNLHGGFRRTLTFFALKQPASSEAAAAKLAVVF